MILLNKKYLLAFLLVIFILFAPNVNGQSKTFEATFGTAANDLGNFVQQTQDGGYIICGAYGDAGSVGYYDYSLIKINAYGAVQWTKTFGDSLNDEEAQCVRQTADGSYIVYGSRSGSTNSTAWLVKTDGNGNESWAAEQQGSDSMRYGYGVVAVAEGGYLTASYDNGAADTNYFQLQKTDGSGNIQWGPKNVVHGIGTSSSLALTKDGNYISVGTTEVDYDSESGNYFSMITLVKMNNAGALLWSKSYKENGGTDAYNYLQGFGVDATNDGGYIICGSTTVNTNGGTDIFLLKTNGAGDSLWSKSFGGTKNDVALSVKEIPGGGFVLAGNTMSFGSESTNIFILKTGATGDSLWMRMFGGAGTQTAGNIEVTADSGFVVVGTTNSFGAGENDILILRTDSEGRIPDATVVVPNGICISGSVTLTASAGYIYLWNTGATTQSITVSHAGNYYVTLKDNYNNINVSRTIPITIDHHINVASFTVSGHTSFCVGGSVDLIADSVAGYLYQWQANASAINGTNSRRYSASEDGNYNVVISNACNAVASSTVDIHVLPLPQVPTISLVGKNLVSSSNTGNQWYRNGIAIAGAVNDIYTPIQDGTFTVVVGDTNQCTSVSQPLTLTTVEIEESTSTAFYILFPNPAADVVYINYHVQSSSKNYFVIYCTEGKEVYREKLDAEKGLLSISTGQLASGLYFSGIETQGAFAGRTMLAVLHR